ncbi:39S ribosomal protein L12, mitochondrial-like isoform X1 [Vespa mandarinia]|uniref:39S ribosomal protein L12, mitochondrial-like isoform X1 n=1 Tax=Vespa mandarinia TaxID=7446 RepID=UPI001610482D|nr:39S ribosomal protein L12, mitochondrial-like isoform X1 [Vespa mandarinia]
MIFTLRVVGRKSIHQFRQFHKCIVVCQTDAAPAATSRPTEPLTIPIPEGLDKPVNPKLDKIANDITSLNLIEVMELSNLLKKRLNLPDAPIMPVGGFMAAPKSDEVEEEPKQVKSSFTVKLIKFDDKQKVSLIKEIKNLLPNTNLVQAKKFIESVPVVVMKDISQDEATKLKESIEKVGGEIEIT